MTAQDALDRLIAGNGRYVAGRLHHPNQSPGRRMEVTREQTPFAVIVSCSDSRVPPEVVFDQGLGDLYVVRTAGHVVDDVALGSIEHAVLHLGVRLVMVMGHQYCGAVTAAASGAEGEGHVAWLVEAIAPAVQDARSSGGDLISTAVDAHVARTMGQLLSSEPILAPRVAKGQLTIVGACYQLDDGEVRLLD
ncbi:carbonic anhydrase [bacterium]|nr:carbonic anhydrase [bacterium]